uniref:hypothetical protein n=1 Tax=Prevotella sp. TaxID=59823 RepID=UPI0040256F87
MKKRFLFAVLLLSLSIVTLAQIRSDYKKGMQIPDKINLIAVAPKGIIKLTLEKPYPNGFHTLIAKKDNAREETEFIRLMIFEVDDLLSRIWGRGSIAQKKTIMKNYFLSLGCTQNKYGYLMFNGQRWHDAVVFDFDDKHYIYPSGFDKVITREDTKDKYFGRPSGFENVLTDLLPQAAGITHLEMAYNVQKRGDCGIIVQTNRNYANQYYYREISKEEMDEINYSISGNYPRKLKEDYICSKLIAYGVNTVGNPSSKWRLFQINKNNGNLDIFTATPVNRSNSSNISLRSLLFDFIRSKVFTKQELEWYNQHFTKEQLDAMTGFGLGIATGGGNGQYVFRSFSTTFTKSAKILSHDN